MNINKSILKFLFLSVLLLTAAVSVSAFAFMNDLSLQQLKTSIYGLGEMAPAVFIIVCIARGVIFLPCGLLSALAGMLFGPLPGTIFALCGLTAGSVATFWLARCYGTTWAKRVLGHRYDRYEGYISRDSFYSIFLMRVVPILPFDVVSCIAGVSRARTDKYIIATLLGALPGVSLYVFFGDSVRSMSLKKIAVSASLMAVFALLPFFCRQLIKFIKKLCSSSL